MALIIKALLTGIIVGALCTKLKLPLPAPPSLVGVMGIVGIYLGYVIMLWFQKGGM
jgi:XapX domain-containing protein